MIKAKDAAKKSEQFLAKMERSGFEAEPVEYYMIEETLEKGQQFVEYCIQQLTSEEVGPLISNKEELIERMFKY